MRSGPRGGMRKRDPSHFMQIEWDSFQENDIFVFEALEPTLINTLFYF